MLSLDFFRDNHVLTKLQREIHHAANIIQKYGLLGNIIKVWNILNRFHSVVPHKPHEKFQVRCFVGVVWG